MDRRTIVALGLIGLIFVLLPFYWEWIGFSQKPPAISPTDHPAADSTGVLSPETLAAVDSAGAARPAVAPGSVPAGQPVWDTLPEQFTTVETDLYTARLSSRGATVASFKLKRFEYLNGDGAIELVPHRDAYPLYFALPEVSHLTFEQVAFTPSALELGLQGDGPDSLTLAFSGSTSDGAPVRVEYTFRRSSYLIGLKVQHAELFDLPMGDSQVLSRTLEVAARLELQIVQLPTAFDVDDYAGLQRLERLLEEDTSIPALHTRAWLNQNTF